LFLYYLEITMKKFALVLGALAAATAMHTAHAAVTTYNVVETFYEPDTQPKNTIFTGSFTFDSVTQTVSGLSGFLTESMTGNGIDDMNKLALNYQLSAVYDAGLGGLLVTTFLLPTTNTFTTNPAFGGTDGWEPGSGFGLYYGFPKANIGNAYARIFVNTSNPLAPLTQAQIDKLAYADCAPGGMMGATCMTGTTIAGYGSVGTMSGYPISQVITVASVPEPETYAMLLAGLGLMAGIARRRTQAI
jgi:PEP-CTERM motif